jgi:hypothetical protein
MDRNVIILIVLSVVNIPLYLVIGKVLFGGWVEFLDAVKFWFTPDVFSLFRGEYADDFWAELKIGLFVVLCGACVFGEFRLIQKLFMD